MAQFTPRQKDLINSACTHLLKAFDAQKNALDGVTACISAIQNVLVKKGIITEAELTEELRTISSSMMVEDVLNAASQAIAHLIEALSKNH